jgi:hypothetical protein
VNQHSHAHSRFGRQPVEAQVERACFNERAQTAIQQLIQVLLVMPRLQPASGGKYAAFLFAAYALFLGIAEVVSLKAVV